MVTDHPDELLDVLAEHAVFGFEPELRIRAAREAGAAGYNADDLRLLIDYARASGKRRMERVFLDLHCNGAWLHAIASARAWRKQEAEEAEAKGERDDGGWKPRLRDRNPKTLTHDERLSLVREVAHEFHPESMEQFATFVGVDIDAAYALLDEAGVSLSYAG